MRWSDFAGSLFDAIRSCLNMQEQFVRFAEFGWLTEAGCQPVWWCCQLTPGKSRLARNQQKEGKLRLQRPSRALLAVETTGWKRYSILNATRPEQANSSLENGYHGGIREDIHARNWQNLTKSVAQFPHSFNFQQCKSEVIYSKTILLWKFAGNISLFPGLQWSHLTPMSLWHLMDGWLTTTVSL